MAHLRTFSSEELPSFRGTVDNEAAVLGSKRELARNESDVVGEVDHVAAVAKLTLTRKLENRRARSQHDSSCAATYVPVSVPVPVLFDSYPYFFLIYFF